MKNKIHTFLKISALILIFSCTVQLFSSCAATMSPKSKSTFDYFDTVTTLSAYATEKEFENIWETLCDTLEYYHKLCDIYGQYEGINNLCTLNKNAGKSAVKLDREIIDFLAWTKEIYTLTDGKVNVAMGSVLSIWHSYRESGLDDPDNAKLPPISELEERKALCNIDDLVIERDKNEAYLAKEGMSLDVGALAKGYALERALEKLREKGYTNLLVSAGGNVASLGKKPNGEKWNVAINDPSGGTNYPAFVEISDESLVTSGSYQRFYTVDGKKYHHIIDPETLMPGGEYVSLTVKCADSGLADALSTYLFLVGVDEGMKVCERLKVEAIWIDSDGKVISSKE